MTENELARQIVDLAYHIHVEVKSIAKGARVHKKQLLTYLRLTGKRLGLVINFGEELIKTGIMRVVNGLAE